MNLTEQLSAFLQTAKNADVCRLVVAYSGGVDSHVLLHALQHLNAEIRIPLFAVHIDHQIQSESILWSEHCAAVCLSLGIPLEIIKVDGKALPGESPEEKARQARYKAIQSFVNEGDWLITAQHQDDQAETLCLQLLRGAGVYGLAAMPKIKTFGEAELHRPLLSISRKEIQNYADKAELKWIEDPSNNNLSIPRNYLRHSVLPRFETLWPEYAKQFSNSANWLGEARTILADLAVEDLQFCSVENTVRGLSQNSILIEKLKTLSKARQKNCLQHWFSSKHLKRPGKQKLSIIFQEVIDARDDANPELRIEGYYLKRYRGKLYLVKKQEIDKTWRVQWQLGDEVQLSAPSARINIEVAQGEGISLSTLKQTLHFCFRQGGEKCRPTGRAGSRSLKKLFQEYEIPPWQRDVWPLLYLEDKLIAVPGLFICEGFEAKKCEEGLKIELLSNL